MLCLTRVYRIFYILWFDEICPLKDCLFSGNSSGDNTSAAETNNDDHARAKVFNIDENSVQMESDTGGGEGGGGGGNNNNNNNMDIQNSAAEDTDKTKTKRKRKHTRRGSKKNKPRKPRQQKFKPYNTLTWDEKRKLVEIDSVRAMQRRRELMLQKGCPIAPYNTTQFLMEEHAVPENLEHHHHHHNDNNNTTEDTNNAMRRSVEPHDADTSSSSVSDDEYFDRDFNEFYDTVHMDTLNSYSKEHLISYIYELERKVEELEKSARTGTTPTGGGVPLLGGADQGVQTDTTEGGRHTTTNDVPGVKGELAQRAI